MISQSVENVIHQNNLSKGGTPMWFHMVSGCTYNEEQYQNHCMPPRLIQRMTKQ